MNYIKQLTEVSRLFYKDKRLKPTHISLYHAIFQMANAHQFPREVKLPRMELMNLSKIKSKATFYKCLNQLDKWNFIDYLSYKNEKNLNCLSITKFYVENSSKNELRSSKNELHSSKNELHSSKNELNPSFSSKIELGSSKNEQLAYIYINIYNIYINNNNIYNRVKNEILLNIQNFFKENFKKKYADVFSENDLVLEAEKFFNHYEANQWKRGKNNPITDFRPVANAWMITAKSYKLQNKRNFQPKNDLGVVHTKREKNYSEPL
ncbi:MAG: hypothetical protein LAT51_13635 [Flavobacteriaceae bacterium]|nr:hypothetical protein [Flavobacteriaceae bacterium]